MQDFNDFKNLLEENLFPIQYPLNQLPKHGDFVLNPGFLPDIATTNYKDAAVLLPILYHESNPSILLTQRTKHLNTHAGQVAFPGGRIDPEDKNIIDAALREANEEIGLNRSNVDIVGLLPKYYTRTQYCIFPVVGIIKAPQHWYPNEDEVEEIFEVPLAFLTNPSHHILSSRIFENEKRFFYEMPYKDHHIWGVTAGIIRTFYERINQKIEKQDI